MMWSRVSKISHKKHFTTFNQYDLDASRINFKEVKEEIESRQNCPIRLYSFIYNSKDLSRIVESLKYGKSSLRNHILLMVNIILNDYYGNIQKYEKTIISTSVSNRDENSLLLWMSRGIPSMTVIMLNPRVQQTQCGKRLEV